MGDGEAVVLLRTIPFELSLQLDLSRSEVPMIQELIGPTTKLAQQQNSDMKRHDIVSLITH